MNIMEILSLLYVQLSISISISIRIFCVLRLFNGQVLPRCNHINCDDGNSNPDPVDCPEFFTENKISG